MVHRHDIILPDHSRTTRVSIHRHPSHHLRGTTVRPVREPAREEKVRKRTRAIRRKTATVEAVLRHLLAATRTAVAAVIPFLLGITTAAQKVVIENGTVIDQQDLLPGRITQDGQNRPLLTAAKNDRRELPDLKWTLSVKQYCRNGVKTFARPPKIFVGNWPN